MEVTIKKAFGALTLLVLLISLPLTVQAEEENMANPQENEIVKSDLIRPFPLTITAKSEDTNGRMNSFSSSIVDPRHETSQTREFDPPFDISPICNQYTMPCLSLSW